MKHIHEPIFNVEVMLTTGRVEDNLLSAYVLVHDTPDKSGLLSRKYEVHVDDSKDFYGLLHEVIHLVKAIMVDRRIPFTQENDEVIAYLTEHWFKLLWRGLSKSTKNRKDTK